MKIPERRGFLRRIGIKGRVLWITLAPLVAVAVALTAYYTWSRLRILDTSLRNRGEAITRHLAPAAEYGVFSGNHALLATLANAVLREPDVAAVTIADAWGTVLARAGGDPPAEGAAASAFIQFHAPIFPTAVETEDVADSGGRPAETPHAIGDVRVTMSRASTAALQAQTLFEGLVILALGLLFTVLLALRMARGVVEPVRRLTDTVRNIEAGKPYKPLPALAGGEIGQLERSVNAMAEALEQARAREHAHTQDQIANERMHARTTLAHIADGVLTTDRTGRVVYVNPVAEQFTGWTRKEAEGKMLGEVLRVMDERSGVEWEYPLHLCLAEGRTIRHDSHHMLVRRDGHLFAIQDAASPIRDRGGRVVGAVVAIHDVTEIRHMATRMAFLASHDSLTGLVNRREFEARLARIIEMARDQDATHAMLYVDLDQFKIVNDTCGHLAGDELLRQLAQRLSLDVRQQDVLARLGGDEFGLILENCSLAKAQEVAEVMRRCVRNFRFVSGDRVFEVGASIGVIEINRMSGTLAEVLSAADSACYVAKDRGRNSIYVYQPDDHALLTRQGEVEWAQRVKGALADSGFILYAQRIAPLQDRSGRTPFHEVLVRLADDAGGLVSPATFIPAAERYQLMPALDRQVISRVFEMVARCGPNLASHARPDGARFAINLSGQSLNDPGLLAHVMDRFTATGIAPQAICFEITETAAIANLVRATRFIAVLKGMGCTFALDDFGSGLSSFGYLKSLPVDFLKIAGGFVEDMDDDPLDLAMVEAINDIGHILGLATIAESVESAAIAAILRDSGVDYGQGSGIEAPCPLSDVVDGLLAQSAGDSLSESSTAVSRPGLA